MERMMKVQDVLLKAMAKDHVVVGGGNFGGNGSDNAPVARAVGSGPALRSQTFGRAQDRSCLVGQG
jgi:hypothetical protein